jgi:DNA transformation protein
MPRTISQMRNLGPIMERRLRDIGIENDDDLRAMGAVEAYRRLRFVFGREVSIIALYAMAAALRDCDWRRLPPEVKARLDREVRP